jgi:sugar diacid utilization regulator
VPTATLDQLIQTLGPEVLGILTSPSRLRVPVGDIVIYDAVDPPVLQSSDLVLAVGVRPSSTNFRSLLSEAAEVGVAAVVVKAGDDAASLRQVSKDAGVIVIVAPAGMRWGQLALLLRGALDAAGARESGPLDVTDLFALANVAARTVGGPVTIEDAHSRVLAYSTTMHDAVDDPRKQTILGRQVPEPFIGLLRDRGVFRELQRSTSVVHVAPEPALGLRRRLAVAVRAGDQILGSLWVAEGSAPLNEDAETALLDASRLAAVHLIRARNTGYEVWKQREELLRQLLEDRADARVVAEALGFAADRPAAVMGLALRSPRDPVADHIAYGRLAEMLNSQASAFRWQTAATVAGTRMLVLLPEVSNNPERVSAGLRRLGEALAAAAAQVGLEVNVALGPVVPGLRETPSSRAVVDEVLRALSAEPARGPVAALVDIRAAVTLRGILALIAERPDLHAGPVARLRDHDQRRGTNYVETLQAWLTHVGDITQAAKQMTVHPNTFRYRLRAIARVSAIDLEDPAERTIAWLHLNLLKQGQLGGHPGHS